MNTPLQRLREILRQREIDALFVSQADNRRYLSGFTGTAGALLVTDSTAILVTDFRYTEQARMQARDFEVFQSKGEPADWLPTMAADLGLRKVGFEALDFTYSAYQRLTQAIAQSSSAFQLLPTTDVVEGLRAVKEPDEVGALVRAARLADMAIDKLQESLRPGMTENEASWFLEKVLRESGSETVPFELIVAAGPNAALPHHHPSERPIAEGEPVIIDVGARTAGYCSDLTRTVWLGKQDRAFSRVYDIVLGAQLTAIATMQAGMTGEQADSLARTVIEQAGYAERFGHGLGHGIGLAVHETPRLGPNSTGVLANNMVFTVEPGIYIPGWGGVRIEDTVIMEQGRVRPLTKSRKGHVA